MAENKATDLFSQRKPPVSAADQKAKKRILNDYRRERDRLINDIYYGGKGIPGRSVYED